MSACLRLKKKTHLKKVRNRTEIPISYDVRIPARFRSVFHVEEAEGQLGPAESSQIALKFTPEAAGQIATAISVYATEKRYADDDKYGSVRRRGRSLTGRNILRCIQCEASKSDCILASDIIHLIWQHANRNFISAIFHGQE